MKTDPNNKFLAGIKPTKCEGGILWIFFNQLGNFQAPQEPQTPPTQSGGGYGGGNGYGQNGERSIGPNRPQAKQQTDATSEEFGTMLPKAVKRYWSSHWPWRRKILRVIEILNRRTKNNPVLIENLVSENSVVEGLGPEDCRWRCPL